jgi:hypothetical protein
MVTTVRGPSVNRLQPTGPFEENAKVGRVVADLGKRAQDGGASSIMFLPQKGVKYEAYAFAYHTGLAKEMNIEKAPRGPMRGTVVINVSGHASGAITDRVTGWAERALARESIKIGDDATRFAALRAACERAAQELQSDWQKTKASVTIDLGPLAGEGKTLELKRELFERMQKAAVDSDDAGLVQLAVDGNRALRKHFAASNTYNVRTRTPDGQITETLLIPRNNPERIEWATRVPVEIPADVSGEVILEAWPTGSAEVAGYVEARRYRIHVGGDLFDLGKAVEAAQKYQAAHPEVRWDTRFEDEDLERHRVAPSPYPYQDF